MRFRKIKRFYRPNIINISLSLLCLGLTMKFIIPIFSRLRLIPCKIFTAESSHFGLCPVNPTVIISEQGTKYLGFALGDHLYVILYFIFFIVVVPYTIACLVFLFYYRYIKKLVR